MKISVPVFKGQIPRLAPRALPDGFAQACVNGRLLSTNLEGWKNFSTTAALCKTGPINTIFLLDDTYWLHWNDAELAAGAVQVDVARSVDGDDATGRVFLTGLDIPRYTTVALANGGSGCLPQETRPLGVPTPDTAPTVSATIGTDTAISTTDTGASFPAWTTVGTINNAGVQLRYAVEDAAVGNPLPSYLLVVQASPTIAWMGKDAGVGSSSQIRMTSDFYLAAVTTGNAYSIGIRCACSDGGAGPGVTLSRTAGVTTLSIQNSLSIESATVAASTTLANLSTLTWYKLRMTLSRNTDGSFQCLAEVLDNAGTTVLASLSGKVYGAGGWMFLAASNNTTWASGPVSVNFDNIAIEASGTFNDPTDDLNTSYVYTWVNDIGEESGPSPASDIIVKDDGTTVTVITPTSPGSGYDYNVVSKRIYRAITTTSGTSYYFLGEQLVSYTTFEDTLTNATAVLNETLGTAGYELPPSDLRGIMALPNGIYAGFSGRNLCLSAINQPHAWPVAYRYAIDSDIVALGKIDAQVVILGGNFPYMAGGNDPAAFSMVNTEIPQGCVSARSIAYLKGVGVVYASPDGLVGVAGVGQVSLITEELFSREEWQALNPSTIIACAHDNRYIACYTKTDGTRGAFMLQAGSSGFGVIALGFHWTAVYDDTKHDRLHLVLDENVVPEVGSGNAGLQVIPNGRTIYAFDEYDGGSPSLTPRLPYRWRSKKYLMPQGNFTMRRCCVRAEDYDNIHFLLYTDGVLLYEQAVTSAEAFVLPDAPACNYLEFELIGTSSVESIELAEDVEELGA